MKETNFDKDIAKNRQEKDRLERDRIKANEQVKRNYKLKEKKR